MTTNRESATISDPATSIKKINMKFFPSKAEKELWDEYKDKSKTELLDIIFNLILENNDESECFTIVEACKKQLGLKYDYPNAYSEKDLIEFGYPKENWIKVV